MSPKRKVELAREHLDRALPAVTTEDYTEAVTWLFAALEAAIVAIAERHGIDTEKQHWKKAAVAKQLRESGKLPHDFSTTLDVLNEARKVAVYEGETPDLGGESLEDVATDVEAAVELAEAEEAE
ncbi:MAG: HEPN domain-containing protein [Actinomycetota bacterium]|nr:HEPN domain-containing protein [Actinomycetota bacterium]